MWRIRRETWSSANCGHTQEPTKRTRRFSFQCSSRSLERQQHFMCEKNKFHPYTEGDNFMCEKKRFRPYTEGDKISFVHDPNFDQELLNGGKKKSTT